MKKILRSMRDGRKKEELGSAPSAALTLWMDEMEEAKKGGGDEKRMEDGVTIAVDVIPPSELLQAPAAKTFRPPTGASVSSFLLHKLLDPVASCCLAFSRRRNSEKFASYFLRFAVEIFPSDVFTRRERRPQIQVGRSFVRWTAGVKVAAVEVDPFPPLIPRRDETEHRTLLSRAVVVQEGGGKTTWAGPMSVRWVVGWQPPWRARNGNEGVPSKKDPPPFLPPPTHSTDGAARGKNTLLPPSNSGEMLEGRATDRLARIQIQNMSRKEKGKEISFW